MDERRVPGRVCADEVGLRLRDVVGRLDEHEDAVAAVDEAVVVVRGIPLRRKASSSS
jgi:adenosyl cobinamide kinase/adenosyl cobinamide phosphate guanylyltransferase